MTITHPRCDEESALEFSQLMPEKPKAGTVLTPYQKNFDYTIPVLKKTYLSKPRMVETSMPEAPCFLQVGGEPIFIQEEPYYNRELERDGYSFFMAVDEQGGIFGRYSARQ